MPYSGDSKKRKALYDKEYRKLNKEFLIIQNKQYYQKNKKILDIQHKEYRLKHKNHLSIKQKEWRNKNKEKIALQHKEYRKRNEMRLKEKYKKYYQKNKKKLLDQMKKNKQLHKSERNDRCNYLYKNNIQYKLSVSIRTRLNRAIRNNQKSGSPIKDLGCTIDELKIWIESQFQDGMSWDNWSLKGWHIDHKLALYNFDLNNRDQFLIAVNYNNLQPMWAYNNLSKGKK